MKHIITLNDRYLSDWKEKIKPNGKTFVYDLEFTTNLKNARSVSFEQVHLLLIAIRNLVTPRGSTINDGTVHYNIVADNLLKPTTDNDTAVPTPTPTPTPTPQVDNDYHHYSKVEVNLDWLNTFAKDNNLTPIDVALAFGYDGKRIYYGTKVLKGLVRLRYNNILKFADKYPDIHGHWYFTRQGGR